MAREQRPVGKWRVAASVAPSANRGPEGWHESQRYTTEQGGASPGLAPPLQERNEKGGGSNAYLGMISRASLLITTSRRSLRFLPASIMASREP